MSEKNTNNILYVAGKPMLTVFRSSLTPDKSMLSEHHHTAFEITMVLGGGGIYATKSDEFDFTDNDIFFFGTDEYHWIKKLDRKTDFLNIHFEPRFVWSENLGISNRELIKIFVSREKTDGNKICGSAEPSQTIRRLIFCIEKEITERRQQYETLLKVHLVNILVELIRSYGDRSLSPDALSEQKQPYSVQKLRYMDDALNYIDSCLDHDLTLEEISDVAHMSKTYFCDQFRRLNGIPPWEYITIKRIERAISYIETTNLTTLEIASKCGYNSTSNFYYAFKRITGKTPGDYKK